MAARILNQLRRRVKTHRLGVEQTGQKRLGLMAFQPGAGVGQQRKTGGVAFRKAVAAKAANLAHDGLGERRVVATLGHAVQQPLLEALELAVAAPGAHAAAQGVGLFGAEAGRQHRDLHHLFLKDRDPQRALQGCSQLGPRQGDGVAALHPLPRGQIGVHHAALDGARAHDGQLHHQVVETARLQARQHAHLGAAFDLEDAHGVGTLDHGEGGGVVARYVGQCQRMPPSSAGQGQCVVQGAQHAQRQHIHLQQAQGVDVVLVPLDDGAPWHGRWHDGHGVG
ncbi:hypothetical protein Tchar_01868 [Tepidimonas charontis]|uniref:Uncharacterized protein n=1 Tax=Tepidimonas charontis TaxID=2267262 RepID=A0A554XB55_9BURK|nr:hypothetical protein Tchar_01868 [Tepidimonas charontis]